MSNVYRLFCDQWVAGPEPPESQSSNVPLKSSYQSLRVNQFIVLHGEGFRINVIYTAS